MECRVALGCVRDGGNCLCPRCLIPVTRVHNLGKKLDMAQRQTLARTNDKLRCMVERARQIIYEKNYAVDADAVEDILKEESLIPTLVSSRTCCCQGIV